MVFDAVEGGNRLHTISFASTPAEWRKSSLGFTYLGLEKSTCYRLLSLQQIMEQMILRYNLLYLVFTCSCHSSFVGIIAKLGGLLWSLRRRQYKSFLTRMICEYHNTALSPLGRSNAYLLDIPSAQC